MRGQSPSACHRSSRLETSRRLFTWLSAALFCFAVSSDRTAADQQSRPTGPVRAFAPGVLTVIPPHIDRTDAISLHDMLSVRAQQDLQWEPTSLPKSQTLHALAHHAPYMQDIWCLELAFKPLRMIEVDVPQPSGKMQRKLIWYMVYRIRNTGAGVQPEIKQDGEFATSAKQIDNLRFRPQFVLQSQDLGADRRRIRKAYLDRVIPAAIEPIARRELGGGQLHNSVQISQQMLTLETDRAQQGVWGVATWEDIDPSIDFFTVFVGGLTNANRWKDAPEKFVAGDPPGKGRRFVRCKLQLNFWRPGDEYGENEREIRFGAPLGRGALYDCGDGVAYRWVYR